MSDLIGVIPAAGRGSRAYPYTKGIPKCMLEVDGEPNLAWQLSIMREQMGIGHVVVIVGTYGDIIRGYFGDGSRFGVKLTYVENHHVERGLSHSLLLSKPYVAEYFCVMLADECYLDTNHRDLVTTDYRRYLATCAVTRPADPEQVSKNYSVQIENGLISHIIEKPKDPGMSLLGLGTFLLRRDIFDHLQQALEGPKHEPNDPVSVLGRLCQQHEVAPFLLRGHYVNINSGDDLNLANNLRRSRGFDQRSMSLAMIVSGTVESSRRALADFKAVNRFQQIVVVIPPGLDFANSDLEGSEVVRAPSSEYGTMIRTGFDASSGDILFAVNGDGSFSPGDVQKFLEYLKEADMVVGTRTTRQLVHQGTNMRGIVRLGHIALAKILELVWWGYGPSFTDLGCSYRAVWRSTYQLIRPNLSKSGPEYSVELLLETLKCRKRVVEIPVNFRLPRKGIKEKDQTLHTVFAMLRLMLTRRVMSPIMKRRSPSQPLDERPFDGVGSPAR